MLTFNLKKEWFDKIKSGEKTTEYRIANNYWITRISNAQNKCDRRFENFDIKFACGYPSKTDKDEILYAEVLDVYLIENGINTDLKTNEKVIAINFELYE